MPANARPGAAPDWKVIDRTRRSQWHDHRIHRMSTIPPKQVTDKSRRTKVFDWKVPLQVGATAASVDGTLLKGANGSTVAPKANGLVAGRKRLRAAFAKNLPSGRYTVSWRVRAGDGDTEKGAFSFRVR